MRRSRGRISGSTTTTRMRRSTGRWMRSISISCTTLRDHHAMLVLLNERSIRLPWDTTQTRRNVITLLPNSKGSASSSAQ
jgi:hypothetical protein